VPALTTPFQTRDLTTRLSGLFPAHARRSMQVDLVDALANDWLELHYQPKIDPRSLMLCGAQAVIQLRHPTWGLVSPASFIALDGDPHFVALSEFVLAKAMADWRYFRRRRYAVESRSRCRLRCSAITGSSSGADDACRITRRSDGDRRARQR